MMGIQEAHRCLLDFYQPLFLSQLLIHANTKIESLATSLEVFQVQHSIFAFHSVTELTPQLLIFQVLQLL